MQSCLPTGSFPPSHSSFLFLLCNIHCYFISLIIGWSTKVWNTFWWRLTKLVKGSSGSTLLLGETAWTSLEHPKHHPQLLYHKVALKIYSGNCSLESLLQAIKDDILHFPEGGRGSDGAGGNARGNPPVHSSSQSLRGLAGQAAAHMEGSTRDTIV